MSNWFENLFINEAKPALESRECLGDGTKVEKNYETIIPATDFQFMIVTGEDGVTLVGQHVYNGETGGFDNINEGDTCRVVWDGKDYLCAAVVDSGELFIGNVTGVDDGPPFIFWCDKSGAGWSVYIIALSAETTHNVALYLQHENMTAVGSFPFVELETVVSTEGETALSEGDIAKLSVAMDAKMPAVIRFGTNSGTNTCSVFNYLGVDGMRRFSTTMDGVEIMFVNMGDQWVCGVQPLT